MRSLIDLIKNLEQNYQPVSAELTVDPSQVKDVSHDLKDLAAQTNATTPDYEITVDADTVTAKTDSDDVLYVGDQEAEVSAPRRNNVKKYGRTFQR
jgi:hypothetical protein